MAATSSSVRRRKARRPLARSSTAASRLPALRVRSGPARAATAARTPPASERGAVGQSGLQPLGDLLGLAAEHHPVALVGHRAVIEDVEQLIAAAVGVEANLGHQDLHLHRLELVGEDLPEALGVGVGQAAGVHVLAAEEKPFKSAGSTDGATTDRGLP